MPNLKALAEDLRSLPGKQRRRNLVGLLARMQQHVDKAAANLADAAASANYATDFVGPDVAKSVRENAAQAARRAVQLRRLLSDVNNIEMGSSADQAVTTINTRADAACKAVRDAWKARIEELSVGYEALAVAAEQAQLPGRYEMRKAVARFTSAAGQPPSTATAALKVRADQDALTSAIGRLGIEGIVGEFLVAASQGRGDPRHLLEEEVVGFLDANSDIWRLLKVKLA